MRLPWARLSLAAFVFSGVLTLFSPERAPRAAVEQPIRFNHEAMVALGVQCLYCHADARRSEAAGMPSMQRCMGCHKVIATDEAPIQELTAYWEAGEPVEWKRVYTLPRFTYFSHRMHVMVGGINCETCHGDVAHMAEAQEVVEMNMGWCLDCHRSQPNASQLQDCIVCHQ